MVLDVGALADGGGDRGTEVKRGAQRPRGGPDVLEVDLRVPGDAVVVVGVRRVGRIDVRGHVRDRADRVLARPGAVTTVGRQVVVHAHVAAVVVVADDLAVRGSHGAGVQDVLGEVLHLGVEAGVHHRHDLRRAARVAVQPPVPELPPHGRAGGESAVVLEDHRDHGRGGSGGQQPRVGLLRDPLDPGDLRQGGDVLRRGPGEDDRQPVVGCDLFGLRVDAQVAQLGQDLLEPRPLVKADLEEPGQGAPRRLVRDLVHRDRLEADPGADLVGRMVVADVRHERKRPDGGVGRRRDPGDVGIDIEELTEDGARRLEGVDLLLVAGEPLDLDEVVAVLLAELAAGIEDELLRHLLEGRFRAHPRSGGRRR